MIYVITNPSENNNNNNNGNNNNINNFIENQSINTEIIRKIKLFFTTVQLHYSFTSKTKIENLF